MAVFMSATILVTLQCMHFLDFLFRYLFFLQMSSLSKKRKKTEDDDDDSEQQQQQPKPKKQRKKSKQQTKKKKSVNKADNIDETKVKAPKYSLQDVAPVVDPIVSRKQLIRKIQVNILSREAKLPHLTSREQYHERKGYEDDIAEMKQALLVLEQECTEIANGSKAYDPPEQIDNSAEQDKCVKCNIPLMIRETSSRLVCRSCGTSIKQPPTANHHYASGNDLETKAPVSEKKKTFRKYIVQFFEQAPEIPKEVINAIRECFERFHVKSTHEIRKTRVSHFIKELKLTDYKNDADRITMILNNLPVPKFTLQQLVTLMKMFSQSQIPFLAFKGEKTNFLPKVGLFRMLIIFICIGTPRFSVLYAFRTLGTSKMFSIAKSSICYCSQ